MCTYKIDPPPDEAVIYYSRSDGCWIAHSLNTDQVATGESVLEAYVELLSVIESLLSLAQEDKDILVVRKAPENILELADRAQPLPSDLYDYAYKKLHGTWPSGYELGFVKPPLKSKPLKLEIREKLYETVSLPK